MDARWARCWACLAKVRRSQPTACRNEKTDAIFIHNFKKKSWGTKRLLLTQQLYLVLLFL